MAIPASVVWGSFACSSRVLAEGSQGSGMFLPVAGREVQNAPSISQSSPHPHRPASPALPSPCCSAAIHIDFSLPCAKP